MASWIALVAVGPLSGRAVLRHIECFLSRRHPTLEHSWHRDEPGAERQDRQSAAPRQRRCLQHGAAIIGTVPRRVNARRP